MAGVDAGTPLGTALDVLQVLVLEVPVDELKKWRHELDVALWKIRPPDRSTWGLAPEQQAATERLIGQRPDGGVADTRAPLSTPRPSHPGRAPQRPRPPTPAAR